MHTAVKIGLGVLGLGFAYVLLAPTKVALAASTPQPQPQPPGPPQLTPGEIAQKGDEVEVPVSYLYPRAVPFDPNRTFPLQANEHIDTIILQLTNVVGTEVMGVTTGFTFSGPSRSSSSSIPDRIPTPLFSRGAILSVVRNGVRIA